MEQIMKLPIDTGNVVLSEDYKSILKNLFSGCRVNFLLGAGFSANLLGTLSNNEVIFEAIQKHHAKNDDERKKKIILSWLYQANDPRIFPQLSFHSCTIISSIA